MITIKKLTFLSLFLFTSLLVTAQIEKDPQVWQEEMDMLQGRKYTLIIPSKIDDVPITNIRCDKDGVYYSTLSDSLEKASISINIAFIGEDIPILNLGGVFLNGKKESLWQLKTSSFRVSREETFHDGQLHGISRVYASDGNLLYETLFDNGTGYYVDYYYNDNQIFIKGHLVNGKREGIWKTYFKSGQVKYEENYKEGLLHGKYISHDEDGTVLYTTNFEKGTGWYKSFDLKTKKLFEEGKIENGYRMGRWIERYYRATLNGEFENKVITEYTPDSPENRRLHHNLIHIVYYDGRAYYVNAADLQDDALKTIKP